MAYVTVSARLDKKQLEEVEQVEDEWKTDRSSALRRLLSKALEEHRLEKALELLKRHRISLGRAAEMSGKSLWEMMDIAARKDIDWTGYSDADLQRDLAILRKAK